MSWLRDFLKPLESVDWTGLWTYVGMAGLTEEPTPFNTTGKKIGLSEHENGSNLDMLTLLTDSLREPYSNFASFRVPSQKAL